MNVQNSHTGPAAKDRFAGVDVGDRCPLRHRFHGDDDPGRRVDLGLVRSPDQLQQRCGLSVNFCLDNNAQKQVYANLCHVPSNKNQDSRQGPSAGVRGVSGDGRRPPGPALDRLANVRVRPMARSGAPARDLIPWDIHVSPFTGAA